LAPKNSGTSADFAAYSLTHRTFLKFNYQIFWELELFTPFEGDSGVTGTYSKRSVRDLLEGGLRNKGS